MSMIVETLVCGVSGATDNQHRAIRGPQDSLGHGAKKETSHA